MDLPKVYNPKDNEAKIYDLWELSGCFKPSGKGKTFSMVLPPNNANGNPHMGHAYTLAIHDIAMRYHRMKGEKVLFIPGTDHAGFETQVVFERQLEKEGKSRFDFNREELYSLIYDFVQMNKINTENNLKKFGGSFDWSTNIFSLDKKVVDSAYSRFKKMWDQGLIYRGERLVNYCTFHGTGFADYEVEFKEEQGHLWYINYPVTNSKEFIKIATTRPETLLGDTAVAVNPKDKRFEGLIGKTVKLPITGREVPIIADEFVDPKFGTGAVKITPAHDPNDYEAAQRHSLPFITVIDLTGKITHEMPEDFRGLDVVHARKKVVEAIDSLGLLSKTEDYRHSVGHCYKCKTIIQPLLKEQWFIDMKPLAKEAIKVLEDKKIKFYPDSKRNQLIGYLNQLRDWNISRQISWGIPIPAFQNEENPDDWIFSDRVGQELIEVDNKTFRRDPDVFDTWFSSSSWPYVALDFPNGQNFNDFYPLSLMDTGGEILFPWVSRMIMLSLYETGQIPFKEVYIHGYVLAEDGAKMSKSLGNVINPMEVLDKYGSDALRMGMIAGRVAGVNRGYDTRKVEDARNFCNKIWNIARFCQDKAITIDIDTPEPESIADNWILNRLESVQNSIDNDLGNYLFGEAYEKLYHFIWDDFADWYIEASKVHQNDSVLGYTLKKCLQMLHPYAPFLTEAIWQSFMANTKQSILAITILKKGIKADASKSKEFDTLINQVIEIRNISNNLKLKMKTLNIASSSQDEMHNKLLIKLARINKITNNKIYEGIKLTTFEEPALIVVDQKTKLDYSNNLDAKIKERETSLHNLEQRISNSSYLEKAPKQLVQDTKNNIDSIKQELTSLKQDLNQINN